MTDPVVPTFWDPKLTAWDRRGRRRRRRRKSVPIGNGDGEDDDDEDDDDEDDDHEDDDDDEDRRRGPTTLMIGVGGQINITSCRQFHILGAQELAFADSCTHIAANRDAGRAARTEVRSKA